MVSSLACISAGTPTQLGVITTLRIWARCRPQCRSSHVPGRDVWEREQEEEVLAVRIKGRAEEEDKQALYGGRWLLAEDRDTGLQASHCPI